MDPDPDSSHRECATGVEHSPALPLFLAFALLPRAVGMLLEFVGKQHAVMARVFEEGAQPVVLPSQRHKNSRGSHAGGPNHSDR